MIRTLHLPHSAHRAVSGMAMGGLTVVVNIYAIELADPDVRGMMGMMLNLGIMAGTFLCFSINSIPVYAMAFVPLKSFLHKGV